jgi:hypothetical protein
MALLVISACSVIASGVAGFFVGRWWHRRWLRTSGYLIATAKRKTNLKRPHRLSVPYEEPSDPGEQIPSLVQPRTDRWPTIYVEDFPPGYWDDGIPENLPHRPTKPEFPQPRQIREDFLP